MPQALAQNLMQPGKPITSSEESGVVGWYFVGFAVSAAGMFRKIVIEATQMAGQIQG